MVERVGDEVERRAAEPLARQHVGDAGRVGGERLGGDPALRVVEGDDLLRPEEGVARRHLGRAPGRRRRERGAAASAASRAQRRTPRRAGRRAAARRSRRRPRRSRRRRRSRSRSRARARCRARSRRCRAISLPVAPVPRTSTDSRSGSQAKTLGASAISSSSTSSPSIARPPPAQLAQRGDRLGQQLARRRPRCGGGRRRARRSSSALGLVDSTSVTERSTMRSSIRLAADVEDRRLGEAAAELVDRVEDDVGAAGERVGGQLVGEGEVRAPGLVDDERDVAGVGDLGQAGDVGDGAEVGRRDDEGGDRLAALLGERLLERLGRQAVGDAELVVDLGRDEARAAGRRGPARRSPRSGRCAGRSPTSPRWARAMQTAWLPPEAPLTRNQMRCAPQASAASRCARWNGVSSGSGPMSTPSIPAGRSSASASLADRLDQPRVGAAPALVPGNVEAPRLARRRARRARRGRGCRLWSTRCTVVAAGDWGARMPPASRC